MPDRTDSAVQESLDLEVAPDIVVLVKRLTELMECIRRAVGESQDARERSHRMGLEEITRELDMGRLRLTRARQILEQYLVNGPKGDRV